MTSLASRSPSRRLNLESLETRALLTTLFVTDGGDAGPGTFRDALDQASSDPAIDNIFIDNSIGTVQINTPLTYQGEQDLLIDGKGTIIEPQAGQEGAIDLLVSDGGADLRLRNLVFQNGAHGVLVPVPGSAEGVVSVGLNNVQVKGNSLFGLLVDDQTEGSDASVRLDIRHSRFTGNGTGVSDSDGVRAQEGGAGDIIARVIDSQFDGNGADGLELDERGDGDVRLTAIGSSFDENGFFDPDDLDDGLDLDEADAGSLNVRIVDSTFNGNFDEGIDFDEADSGDVNVSLVRVQANDNEDEGIKIDEAFAVDADDNPIPGTGGGDLIVSFVQVESSGSKSQEGIALTEEGIGDLIAELRNVVVDANDRDGIEMEENDDGDLKVVATNVTSTSNDGFGLVLAQDDDGDDVGTLRLRNAKLTGNTDGDLDIEGVDLV